MPELSLQPFELAATRTSTPGMCVETEAVYDFIGMWVPETSRNGHLFTTFQRASRPTELRQAASMLEACLRLYCGETVGLHVQQEE